MNRRKKLPFSFLLIFIAAILIAFLLTFVVPIPAKYDGLLFFGAVSVLSFIGVCVISFIKKNRH